MLTVKIAEELTNIDDMMEIAKAKNGHGAGDANYITLLNRPDGFKYELVTIHGTRRTIDLYQTFEGAVKAAMYAEREEQK